jgi:SAM-dependent methyltransferase
MHGDQRYDPIPEYVDFAEYYDFDHAITIDIEFYLDFANHCRSPILELACGTGRLLIPLARAGFEVFGIDISTNMLVVCQQAIRQHHIERQVHLSQADMSSFDLPYKNFSLVLIALRSFMHLLTPAHQIACLRQVYDHLQPGGYFLLDVIAPDPQKLSLMPSSVFVVRREFDLPNGHHVMRKERLVDHDSTNQIRHFEFKFEEYDLGGQMIRERRIPLYTRYLYRDELQLLLDNAGFQVDNVFRDYNRNPYDGTGEMIVVARRPQ